MEANGNRDESSIVADLDDKLNSFTFHFSTKHYLLHVPSTGDKVSVMDVFDTREGLEDDSTGRVLILVSNEAAAQKYAMESFAVRISSSESADEANDIIDKFNKRSFGFDRRFMIWSRSGLPEGVNFSGLAHVDVPCTSEGEIDASMYKKRVDSLSPRVVYNIASDDSELKQWRQVEKELGIELMFRDLHTSQLIWGFRPRIPITSYTLPTKEELDRMMKFDEETEKDLDDIFGELPK